ncbi:hypothetical protein PG995_013528 [Apiospora arundinis]
MALQLLTTVGLLASGAAAAGHLFPDCQTGPLSSNAVCNTKASVADRAKALVAALTIEEKIALTGSTSPAFLAWVFPATNGGRRLFMVSHRRPESPSTSRTPRWGRGQETPGEDTFHIKSYVKSLIEGLQGNDPDHLKVVATCKHFVGYDIENWNGNERYGFDAIINPQELSEYYMQPFQACARDAKVASIMCSYNALNGVPTCADSYLLQDVLRDHWNWTDDGFYVTSDCDSIQNVFLPHNYTDTREEAVAYSLIAGTDLDCGSYYGTHLPAAYEQGLFNDTTIDQALVRLYSAQIRLGMFDPANSQAYRALSFGDVNTPDSQALALKVAEEGIVLIKNDGTLPLQTKNRNMTIAVIGPWANATTTMQGNYAGVAPYLRSPYLAAKDLPGVNVLYAGSPGDPTTDGYPAAIKAAKAADVILYADGSNSGEERDRNLIRWSGERQDIMTLLAGYGKPFILLQMGDQLDDTPFLHHENVSAILWAGFPGQSGGDAIMNIITGKTAPAGRMPVTQYPAHYVDDVPMTDMNLRPNATSGNPGRTYMWYNESVVDFGFGLHYTNFTTSFANNSDTSSWDIQSLTRGCSETYKDLCAFRSVAVSVQNEGSVKSDFVTLGFVAGEHGPAPHPIKQLVAYERLFAVEAGATATAHLNLTLGSLARHDDMGHLVLYPGDYSLLVDVPTQATWNFTLTGKEATLEEWPQAPSRQ